MKIVEMWRAGKSVEKKKSAFTLLFECRPKCEKHFLPSLISLSFRSNLSHIVFPIFFFSIRFSLNLFPTFYFFLYSSRKRGQLFNESKREPLFYGPISTGFHRIPWFFFCFLRFWFRDYFSSVFQCSDSPIARNSMDWINENFVWIWDPTTI